MILGLFPLKPADKIVCFDLIFYVFFFLTSILSHIGPNQTVSAHIGPNRVLFQTVLDRIGPRWKKKKICPWPHGASTQIQLGCASQIGTLVLPWGSLCGHLHSATTNLHSRTRLPHNNSATIAWFQIHGNWVYSRLQLTGLQLNYFIHTVVAPHISYVWPPSIHWL